MTLVFSRFGKRAALIALKSIFTLGNVMSALSPDYWTLLISRVVTSLNHDAFFGLGSVVAASVVRLVKQASAVATMFMGLTIANIGGVPAATWVGQQIGWREAFAGTSVLGLIAIAALWLALPNRAPGVRPDMRHELGVLTRPEVLIAMLTTMMGASAMFTLYTYVAPILQSQNGASDGFITLVLVLIGIGFTVRNWLGGRLADWSLDGATAIFMAALVVIMLAIPFLLGNQGMAAITLTFCGAFALVPPVQMRVMQTAHEAPGLASSINIGAFKLGNAVGAALGGAVIRLNLGYAAVPAAGGVMALAGLALIWLGHQRTTPILAVCEA